MSLEVPKNIFLVTIYINPESNFGELVFCKFETVKAILVTVIC